MGLRGAFGGNNGGVHDRKGTIKNGIHGKNGSIEHHISKPKITDFNRR